MTKGWLVHDKLTCIPGTKTFWHDLLDWVPGLEDRTNNGELGDLPTFLKQQQGECDYIIRNATYWPWIDTGKPTISLLQDIRQEQQLIDMQLEVIEKSTRIVAVSNFVADHYQKLTTRKIDVIPIGVDFDKFVPGKSTNKFNIKPNSVIWIGDVNDYPKGFDILRKIILDTNYNFVVVLKSNKIIDHPRVQCFNRLEHCDLIDIMRNCFAVLCTSRAETLHLASIECGAVGLGIATSDVGAYYKLENYFCNAFNIHKCSEVSDYIKALENIQSTIIQPGKLSKTPRQFLYNRFSTDIVKNEWISLIGGLN